MNSNTSVRLTFSLVNTGNVAAEYSVASHTTNNQNKRMVLVGLHENIEIEIRKRVDLLLN